MKYTLLLSILYLAITTTKAQQVDTAGWCPPGAVWIYSMDSPVLGVYLKLTYEKDTVILNKNVKKIVANSVSYYSSDPIVGRQEQHVTDEYEYLSNDSLYFYDPVTDSFILKFDFNAQVGDSIVVQNPRSTCMGGNSIPDRDTLYIDDIVQDTFNDLIFDRFETSYGHYQGFRYPRIIKYIGSDASFHPEVYLLPDSCNAYYQTYGLLYWSLAFYQDSARGALNIHSPSSSNPFHQNIINEVIKIDHKNASPQQEIMVYPNPSSDLIYLDLKLNDPATVHLYNLAGQQINSFSLLDNYFSIKNLPKGLYLLKIQVGTQKIYHAKFTKQ